MLSPAVAILAEIGDIKRFSNANKLAQLCRNCTASFIIQRKG
ncbi:MAG: transposase [Roseburia inulinivorans]